jgi:prolyl-tRNA synthetase
MVSIAQQSVSTAAPTQTIKITGVAGRDFVVSGLEQKIVVNIDVQKFLSNVTETSLKSMMTSALETTAKDNQEVEHQLTIGGSYAANTSAVTVRNNNVNRIVNSYSYSQFVSDVQQVLASQTIDISGLAERDVTISNLSQYIKIELISKQIADNMTTTYNSIKTDTSTTTTKETTQATSSGISMAWLMSGIIIFVIIVAVIAGFVWYFGGSDIVKSKLGGHESAKIPPLT